MLEIEYFSYRLKKCKLRSETKFSVEIFKEIFKFICIKRFCDIILKYNKLKAKLELVSDESKFSPTKKMFAVSVKNLTYLGLQKVNDTLNKLKYFKISM